LRSRSRRNPRRLRSRRSDRTTRRFIVGPPREDTLARLRASAAPLTVPARRLECGLLPPCVFFRGAGGLCAGGKG
jgi:hypothetical protein